MNKAFAVILATVMLDAIGIGLIFPILPSLLRDLTGSSDVPLLYGGILAIYAFMQFAFSPILGVLSDKYGRRPVLLASTAGAVLDYLVMAFTPHLWVLVLGRAVAGITSANLAVATAYVTDISNSEERPGRFGYIHALFGIGFIVGPILGGVLGEYWVRAPFVAAAVLNALNLAMAYFFLPESRKPSGGAWDYKTLNPLRPLKWAFSFKAILPLVAIFFVINFVGQVYATDWVLFTEDRFKWDTWMVGLSLAGFGLFHAGAQAILVGPASKLFGAKKTVAIGICVEALALICLALAMQPWMVFALLPVFAVAGIGMPALQSVITSEVDEDKQGQLQGVLSSLTSLSAVFGPLIFSWVYFVSRESWNGSVWIFAAVLYMLCAGVVGMWMRRAFSGTK